jgi:hypothetical protein
VNRHHLAEGAAGETNSGDVDEIDPTGAWLDLRLRTHTPERYRGVVAELGSAPAARPRANVCDAGRPTHPGSVSHVPLQYAPR